MFNFASLIGNKKKTESLIPMNCESTDIRKKRQTYLVVVGRETSEIAQRRYEDQEKNLMRLLL